MSVFCIVTIGGHHSQSSPTSRQQLDLGFIVDASFAQREEFNQVKNFLTMLTRKFTINDDNVRVGIILFNNDASLEVALADFQSNTDIASAVARLETLQGMSYFSFLMQNYSFWIPDFSLKLRMH